MKIDAGKILNFGIKLLPVVVQAVRKVDHDTDVLLAKGETKPSNEEREDAAIGIIRQLISLTEASYGHDLINDAEAEAILRDMIQAVIRGNNALRALAKKKFLANS